ncbi:hypothetical protein D5R40_12865 [Okeania hirsuta]|uniref:Uncharacterized protein n=2 Tax=Microcoleaceae TaxID=1892252 RepID=A0A3N6PUV1_9CYAN|nr:hypothetical protein D4Z78_01080 [Okeania hirsuta]RQH43459.1 hypothetical protein D5R40_12865 [Okeania hirsuta]
MDSNLKERTETGGRCKNCNHPFVFDPQAGSKFTDIFFKNSIQTISSEKTLFFTTKQFWYFLEKRLTKKGNVGSVGCLFVLFFLLPFINTAISAMEFYPLAPIIIFVPLILYFIWASQSKLYSSKERRSFARAIQIIGGLILVAVLVWFFKFSKVKNIDFLLFLLGTGLGIFLIYLGTRQLTIQHKIPQAFQFHQSQIIQWLIRWQEINGKVRIFLRTSRKMSEPIKINSEVTAYSFDRVIVCDTAEIAQFLIANNFHFEHNCAVLSIDGYPQNIFSTVMQMLKQNPDLKIYAFHSANPRGVRMINELRNSPNWFGGNNLIIYDLGLLPRHVFPSKNMWILKSDESARQVQQIPTAVKSTLSTDELAWLEAGFYVELESFSPRKLLQVVSQGIAKTQAVANGYTSTSDNSLDSGDSGDDGIIFIGINNDSRNVGFFASDSFG